MIYHIFANRSNIGDWISAKGIQKLLYPLEITECLCDEPFIEETIDQISKATKDDLVIIGGGGLLMDYFTPFWKAFESLTENLNFVIWGVGFCDIKLEPSLPPVTLIEQIVKKSKLCILRDELSKSFLPGCQLPDHVPCPSLNYINTQDRTGNSILHVVNYTTVGPPAYEAMCQTIQEFSRSSGQSYRETNNIIQKGDMVALDLLLGKYADSSIIISSALHGCIIGTAMGKKVIAVSGDRKIEGYMEAIGLGAWVIDYKEVSRLPQLIAKITFQETTLEKVLSARKKNENIAQTIYSLYQIK